MSEFSNTFHIGTISPKELAKRLSRLGFDSVILDKENSSFLPFISETDPSEVLELFKEPFFTYQFASDHCLEIKGFFDQKELIYLYFDWDSGQLESTLNFPQGQAICNNLFPGPEFLERIQKRVDDFSPSIPFEVPKAFGLSQYESVSHSDLSNFLTADNVGDFFSKGLYVYGTGQIKESVSKPAQPNEFCPYPDQPDYMYFAVSSFIPFPDELKEIASRHYYFWADKWDKLDDVDWEPYNFYRRHLQKEYWYLGDRLVQLNVMAANFPMKDFFQLVQKTVEAIIHLLGKDLGEKSIEKIKAL